MADISFHIEALPCRYYYYYFTYYFHVDDIADYRLITLMLYFSFLRCRCCCQRPVCCYGKAATPAAPLPYLLLRCAFAAFIFSCHAYLCCADMRRHSAAALCFHAFLARAFAICFARRRCDIICYALLPCLLCFCHAARYGAMRYDMRACAIFMMPCCRCCCHDTLCRHAWRFRAMRDAALRMPALRDAATPRAHMRRAAGAMRGALPSCRYTAEAAARYILRAAMRARCRARRARAHAQRRAAVYSRFMMPFR